LPPRREKNADSLFFIFYRAKKQMLAAGGDGHGQSHEAAVALVPAAAPACPPPPPPIRALGAAAAPAPLPAPSGYHTGERPRNRDRWRVGQSPRSLATEPACQRQRYSWTLALPAARKGLRADTARTSEQQARQSSDTALATRAAPTPCAGPRDREREQRTDAAPAARRAAPGAAGGLPRLRGGSPARSPSDSAGAEVTGSRSLSCGARFCCCSSSRARRST